MVEPPPPPTISEYENYNTFHLIGDEDQPRINEWTGQILATEVERLKSHEVSPVTVDVVDMNVLVKGKKTQINRIVFKTDMSFKEVTTVLISKSIPCEFKPGFQCVTIALYLRGHVMPMLFPYVYKTRLRKRAGKNNLKHWVFINRQFEEVEHSISNLITL